MIIEFVKAIISLPSLIKEIIDGINTIANRIDSLKIESMQKELAQYKVEVNQKLKEIENAKTAEERRKLSNDLANAIRK